MPISTLQGAETPSPIFTKLGMVDMFWISVHMTTLVGVAQFCGRRKYVTCQISEFLWSFVLSSSPAQVAFLNQYWRNMRQNACFWPTIYNLWISTISKFIGINPSKKPPRNGLKNEFSSMNDVSEKSTYLDNRFTDLNKMFCATSDRRCGFVCCLVTLYYKTNQRWRPTLFVWMLTTSEWMNTCRRNLAGL